MTGRAQPSAFPKILLLDIETAPIQAFAWEMFEANLCHVIEPTFMLCYAYKWLGEQKVHTKALCDYSGYKNNKISDKSLVTDLWDVLDRADIVVAHNGDAFDIKKTNARLLVHGLPPPTPWESVTMAVWFGAQSFALGFPIRRAFNAIK